MRRLALLAGAAALVGLQVAVAMAYTSRGTWWHWLLHQQVGWGVGLAVAGGVTALAPRVRVPPVPAAIAGQLVSIVPDLLFRYARMPHTISMDWWLGHISLHRGPSPVLVALGVLLLGGWSWLAADRGRSRAGLGLAVATAVLLAGACLLADPLPTRLADF